MGALRSLFAVGFVLSGCVSGDLDDVGAAAQELSSATCVSLSAAADSTLSNPPKNQNFGDKKTLTVQRASANNVDEALLRFDLGAIPAGAVVTRAKLQLFTHGSDCDHGRRGARVVIHRATAAWSEAGVTFASFKQQFDPAVAGVLHADSESSFKSANVTAQVAAWVRGAQPNHGFLLETAAERQTTFVSSEGAHAPRRPILKVCYATAPIDPCAADPCEHGTCAGQGGGFTCACEPEWSGPLCDTPVDIDDCAAQPCQHGGVCTDGVSGYTCACDAGYSGVNCEIDVDDCAGAPCQHGGVCTDGVSGYTCACDAGYSGVNCEIDVDDCAAGPCQNAGTCIDGVNGYTCQCVPGTTGASCEIDIDECAAAPCLNGGACTDGLFGYTCDCAPGYAGPNCDIDVDECAAAPCENGGTCVDGINGFVCECAAGYGGATCGVNLDPCLDGTLTCDDGDSCTSDTCGEGACFHEPIAGCCAGDADCDDGVTCTDDACVAGSCTHGAVPSCCTQDADCDDGNSCNGGEACDGDGQCTAGTPIGCRVINVYFHVIQGAGGSGAVSAQVIQDQLDVLSAAFSSAGFTFHLVSVNTTVNSAWFTMTPGSTAESQAKNALRKGGKRDLNLYSANPAGGDDFATFPSSYATAPKIDGVVVPYSMLPGNGPGPNNLGDVAVHGVGHWMGLYHTFQGGCAPGASAGDSVSDTPPEQSPAFGCPVGRNTCPSPGVDPIHNYMNFTDDACRSEFTPGQRSRMLQQFIVYRD